MPLLGSAASLVEPQPDTAQVLALAASNSAAGAAGVGCM